MFLGGMWHGASWNFVIWGLLHGAYLAIHKMLQKAFPTLANNPFFKSRLGKIISILITQYFVFLAWIPFRVHDTEHMLYSMQKFVIIDLQLDGALDIILTHKVPIAFMIAFVILHFISYRRANLIQTIANMKLRYWGIVLGVILSLIIFFFDGNPEDFIYFRF
jgi:hypothetical protein